MRKSRFTEEQIIKVLKEHAAGLSVGELHYNAKMTTELVRQIRQDERPYRQIAAEHKISQSSVSLIKSRKCWGRIAKRR